MHKLGVDFLAQMDGGLTAEINSLGSFLGNVNGLIHNQSQMARRKVAVFICLIMSCVLSNATTVTYG